MINKYCSISLLILLSLATAASAVTSRMTHHNSAADFLKGETSQVTISSDGQISLSHKNEPLDVLETLQQTWIINTLTPAPDGSIYMGTSPNGQIIRHTADRAETIYPIAETPLQDPVTQTIRFKNEHVFCMTIKPDNSLIAGISGSDARLIHLSKSGREEVLFESSDDTYLLSVTFDAKGMIYLGTGPKGRIYKINPKDKSHTVLYEARDKNVLSLAIGPDQYLYAGCDERGIIYKINPDNGNASVVYDSPQKEITSLLFDTKGNLYAAATSETAASPQSIPQSISAGAPAGKPEGSDAADQESEENGDEDDSESIQKHKQENETDLDVANTGGKSLDTSQQTPPLAERGEMPDSASHIYKIDPRGFVTKIFSEMAVFYDMAFLYNELLIATGNNARLFAVNPLTEEKRVIYEDEKASQITAVTVTGSDAWLGTSNPAKFIRIYSNFAETGSFTSKLIDAKQPASWGKLHVDARIPENSRILLSSRSGNVKDPNDPSFSPWTADVEMKEAMSLTCPVGRYCQYRLTLQTDNPLKSPVVHEVAIASMVPNLAPKVTAVAIEKNEDIEKPYLFKVSYNAKDDNEDKLLYSVEFRKVGRINWIMMKEDLEEPAHEWDTRTVEDGRYEIKVTASDIRSNTETTYMTGARISLPCVIDNTPPEIINELVKTEGRTATVNLKIADQLTVVSNLSYTLNSNKDWFSTLPEDMIYDSISEFFTITLKDLEPGQHILAIKTCDDVGNTLYKTYEINIQ